MHLASSTAIIRTDAALLWLLLLTSASSASALALASGTAFAVTAADAHRRRRRRTTPPTIPSRRGATIRRGRDGDDYLDGGDIAEKRRRPAVDRDGAPDVDVDVDDRRRPVVRICEARYADLPEAARLIADGFFREEMRANPPMRLIRPLLELDRLQGAFPYNDATDDDAPGGGGRHFYLIAREEDENDDDDGGGVGGRGGGRVVGFCDIDGRIVGRPPEAASFSFRLPWTKNAVVLRRPLPYLSDLVVHPGARRRGLASRLLDEAERRAGVGMGMGFGEVYLCLRKENGVALNMYVGRGYEIVETTPVIDEDMVAFLEAQGGGLIVLRRSLR